MATPFRARATCSKSAISWRRERPDARRALLGRLRQRRLDGRELFGERFLFRVDLFLPRGERLLGLLDVGRQRVGLHHPLEHALLDARRALSARFRFRAASPGIRGWS